MAGGMAAGLAVVAGVGAGGAPLFVRHARAAVSSARFGLGVASGQPHAGGMVLWTRLTGDALPDAVDVAWEVAADERFTAVVARGVERAVVADAHSVHAEPADLAPARVHWYRFTALGQQSPTGRTRTAPAPDAPVDRLDFVVASCQRYDTGYYAAWRHAAADDLDMVLFVGDYLYEYASSPDALRPHTSGRVRRLAAYRARYAQYKSDADLQAAHAACPWLMVWDDHEVENDYAGLQSASLRRDFARQRADAYQAYWEHMPLPKSARPVDGTMRMHGQVDWGRLARVHLLDDRQQRDPQACPTFGRGGSTTVALRDCAALRDPQRTLLGAAQERWLAEGWSTDRPWNLVAQQTLMARFALTDPSAGDGGHYRTDGWDGYPPARERLLAGAVARNAPGVVVLGGDVHAHHVADLHLDFDAPGRVPVATEFCGTSISSPGRSQAVLDAARPHNPHVHWADTERRGLLRFRLDARRLQARLQVLDDVLDPASGMSTAARFVVDAARPGAQRD